MRRRRLWLVLAAALGLAVLPVVVLNTAVAFFGNSVVFPLSPFFLREKARALQAYFAHRPTCLFEGHGDLSDEIRTAERRHGLPPGLLGALVKVESEARPHRISFAGAMGPAQLMPATAQHLEVTDPFDPAQSIDGGARYLARQMKRYRDVRLALAAYNAGPGAVSRSVPKNGETEHYVARVLAACRGCLAPRRTRPLRVAAAPKPALPGARAKAAPGLKATVARATAPGLKATVARATAPGLKATVARATAPGLKATDRATAVGASAATMLAPPTARSTPDAKSLAATKPTPASPKPKAAPAGTRAAASPQAEQAVAMKAGPPR